MDLITTLPGSMLEGFLPAGWDLAKIDRLAGSSAEAVVSREKWWHPQFEPVPCATFEDAFAAYLKVKHCIAVNSGTSALHLALIGAGVGPGDEVITVPMTFVATTWAISYQRATPVFVDIDPTTYTMDVTQVHRRITPRTRAILPVHLYGQPADLGPLLELGRKHGIPVIEDAAQAHGAMYQGTSAGTLGLCGCFSFYPGKNLGAFGEGGAVVTNDDRIAAWREETWPVAKERRRTWVPG